MSTQRDNELRDLFTSHQNPLEGKDFLVRVSADIAVNERAKYWRRRIAALICLGLAPFILQLSIGLVGLVNAQLTAVSGWTTATVANIVPEGLQAYSAVPLYTVAGCIVAVILWRDVISD